MNISWINSKNFSSIEYLNRFTVTASYVKPRILIPESVFGELDYNVVTDKNIRSWFEIDLEGGWFIDDGLAWVADCKVNRCDVHGCCGSVSNGLG